MNVARFVFATVAATVGLGIAIDLVTAHVAVDYFRPPFHPSVMGWTSPWALALAWGFGASWWFGLIAAVVIVAFRSRTPQPIELNVVFRWVVRGMAAIWTAMMTIFAGVYALASLVPMRQRRASFEHDRRMIAVAMAHQFEYAFGAIVLIVILILVARRSRA